ncbi:hypothetical protein [Kiritimatiella glycovorans]|uniref:DUF3352 domain-containing protein n=1 Tax=Kiritimatiella glycovorans TaxID=1307763 RepID=A0A0G3EEI0_9BACT|nr:hypothetical protein [Kiritimatiella glycovorans]AKJ64758.1 hypothetical protein L21SP4_01513 [Kiritimatiella glycovorans]
MKKLIPIIIIIAVAIFVAEFAVRRMAGPALPPGRTLYAPNTFYYFGMQNAPGMGAYLAMTDQGEGLSETFDMDTAEAEAWESWIDRIRGVHFGVESFAVAPVAVHAALVLDGSFETSPVPLLPEEAAEKLKPLEPYREVGITSVDMPADAPGELGIFITEPHQNRVVVGLSLETVKGIIDRMEDGGPSLADSEALQRLYREVGAGKADMVQYVDTQRYIDELFAALTALPFPTGQQGLGFMNKTLREQGLSIIRDIFRLEDFGPGISVSDAPFHQVTSCSEVDPDNPFYRLLEPDGTIELPRVPASAYRVQFWRLSDPVLAREKLEGLVREAFRRMREIAGPQTKIPGAPVAAFEALAGFRLADLDALWNGEIGLWQGTNPANLQQPRMCFVLGLKDPPAMQDFLRHLPALKNAELTERGGITSFGQAVHWHYTGGDRLLISADRAFLAESIDASAQVLNDREWFRKKRAALPDESTLIQYTDYGAMLSPAFARAATTTAPLRDLFSAMEDFRVMAGTHAADGLLKTRTWSSFEFDADRFRRALEKLAAERSGE